MDKAILVVVLIASHLLSQEMVNFFTKNQLKGKFISFFDDSGKISRELAKKVQEINKVYDDCRLVEHSWQRKLCKDATRILRNELDRDTRKQEVIKFKSYLRKVIPLFILATLMDIYVIQDTLSDYSSRNGFWLLGTFCVLTLYCTLIVFQYFF
jgi:hypothetical protein